MEFSTAEACHPGSQLGCPASRIYPGKTAGSHTREESHSDGAAVEVYTTVTKLSTLMSQWCVSDVNNNDEDNAVTLLRVRASSEIQKSRVFQGCFTVFSQGFSRAVRRSPE